MCRQWLPTSCLEFREAISGFLKMQNFSFVHRLHLLVTGVKGAPLSSTFHLTLKVEPLALSPQMWVLIAQFGLGFLVGLDHSGLVHIVGGDAFALECIICRICEYEESAKFADYTKYTEQAKYTEYIQNVPNMQNLQNMRNESMQSMPGSVVPLAIFFSLMRMVFYPNLKRNSVHKLTNFSAVIEVHS